MPHSFLHLTDKCFICVPFDRLQNDLQRIIENRIQPEISLEGDVLYDTPSEDFKTIAEALKNAGLSCTLHAPFSDLIPGASDRYIKTVSRDKLHMALQLIKVFKPRSVVCHLNYENNKHDYKQEEWLANSLETWRGLLRTAEKHRIPVMLENTYETGPEMHKRVLAALNSPQARFCLDVGHTLAFAKNSWQDWLPTLTPWLGQLHLHDNHGDSDAHLAVGEGVFDFVGLFKYLKDNKLNPLITLEPQDEKTMWTCLENLDRFNFFNDKGNR